jgi:hypothetical protein
MWFSYRIFKFTVQSGMLWCRHQSNGARFDCHSTPTDPPGSLRWKQPAMRSFSISPKWQSRLQGSESRKAYIWMFPPCTPKRLLRKDPVRPAPPSPEEDTGFNDPVTFGVRPNILMTLVISPLGSPTPATTAGGGIIGQCGTARTLWLDFIRLASQPGVL